MLSRMLDAQAGVFAFEKVFFIMGAAFLLAPPAAAPVPDRPRQRRGWRGALAPPPRLARSLSSGHAGIAVAPFVLMTFQRKLLLGFGLMVLPRCWWAPRPFAATRLERRALETLGESMTRTRTYSEVETAMFDQSEMIWRSLSGLDPQRAPGVPLTGEVVDYWLDRVAQRAAARRAGAGRRRARIAGRDHARSRDSVFALEDLDRRRRGLRVRATGAEGAAPARR